MHQRFLAAACLLLTFPLQGRAQEQAAPLRIRVEYPDRTVVTGTVVGRSGTMLTIQEGVTLQTVDLERGPYLSMATEANFAGRLALLGLVAGGYVGHALGTSKTELRPTSGGFCFWLGCGTGQKEVERGNKGTLALTGAIAGLMIGGLIGSRITREVWVPIGRESLELRVTPTWTGSPGLALEVPLGGFERP